MATEMLGTQLTEQRRIRAFPETESRACLIVSAVIPAPRADATLQAVMLKEAALMQIDAVCELCSCRRIGLAVALNLFPMLVCWWTSML